MRRSSKIVFAIIAIIILGATVLCFVIVYPLSESESTTEIYQKNEISENISETENIFFYQKDEAWNSDFLGSSEYKMGDSGCLTCCVASVVVLQDIEISAITGDFDAGKLNGYFSKNNAYDGEGNMLYDKVGELLNCEFIIENDENKLNETIENALTQNYYPIIKVRVNGNGNYHFILIVKKDNNNSDDYLCMDPMNGEKELVSLANFGEKVYGVRYLKSNG